MKTREQTIERLEAKGFEIVTDLRDPDRRIKTIDGVNCYFSAEEETFRNAEEQDWIDDSDNRKKEQLRSIREPLLVEADHAIFKLEDAASDTSDWKTYRQELRNITEADDLNNVVWPTKPES